MASNWSAIPEELVYLVVERVGCLDDFVRFGAVCKTWKSVSIMKKEQQPFGPLLMLAKADKDNLPTSSNDDDQVESIRTFIIPYAGQGQQDKMASFNLELPKAQGRRCWGSPYGWVVTIGLDFNIHLLNPLTDVQLPLPSQPNLQQQSKGALPASLTRNVTILTFTKKFVLGLGWKPSSSLSSKEEELIVMAIFGKYSEVAFTTTTTCILPGKEIEAAASTSSWKLVEDFGSCHDVIFYQGRIFMINVNGRLCVADINQTRPKAIQIKCHILPEHNNGGKRFYLVEIAECLHMVVRSFEPFFDGPGNGNFYYRTHSLVVSRFNFEENNWYKLDKLGEYALFVGNHTSFALSTTTYPQFSSNSIYFSDDHYTAYRRHYCNTVDMGVFHYEEETIEKFDLTNHGEFSKFSLPTFFMPAL